jgi:hypothetical protein
MEVTDATDGFLDINLVPSGKLSSLKLLHSSVDSSVIQTLVIAYTDIGTSKEPPGGTKSIRASSSLEVEPVMYDLLGG